MIIRYMRFPSFITSSSALRSLQWALKKLVPLGCALAGAMTHAQTLSVTLLDQNANPVEGAVIELLVSDELKGNFQNTTDIVVDQVDKEFVPRVSIVVAGNQVSFPNSDDILHHVYSFAPINTFNIPLYGREEEARFSQEFPISGVVEIGCNIHDWMLAYIYVSETALSSISDSGGLASLLDLPLGNYQLRVWHPRLSESDNNLIVDVEISAEATTNLDLSLELERERKIRRAPSSSKNRYK
jgi:plastocyanin